MSIKITRGLTLAMILSALSMVSCTLNGTSPTGGNGPSLTTEVTVSPARIRAGDEVTVTILIRNEGTRTIDLVFASGQQYDFHIENDAGVLGHHVGVYTLSTTVISLSSGTSRTHQFKLRLDPRIDNEPISWNEGTVELAAGEYRMVGGIAYDSIEYPWSSAPLRITR